MKQSVQIFYICLVMLLTNSLSSMVARQTRGASEAKSFAELQQEQRVRETQELTTKLVKIIINIDEEHVNQAWDYIIGNLLQHLPQQWKLTRVELPPPSPTHPIFEPELHTEELPSQCGIKERINQKIDQSKQKVLGWCSDHPFRLTGAGCFTTAALMLYLCMKK